MVTVVRKGKVHTISWVFKHNLQLDTVQIQINEVKENGKQWMFHLAPENSTFEIPFEIIPRIQYLISVCAMKMEIYDNNSPVYKVLQEVTHNIRLP